MIDQFHSVGSSTSAFTTGIRCNRQRRTLRIRDGSAEKRYKASLSRAAGEIDFVDDRDDTRARRTVFDQILHQADDHLFHDRASEI